MWLDSEMEIEIGSESDDLISDGGIICFLRMRRWKVRGRRR